MFRIRKEKFSVTDGDPIFEVRYLGHRDVDRAYGRGCTTGVVAALWTRCPYEKCLPKAFLQVGLNGIRLSMSEKPNSPPIITDYNVKDISYCCVEMDVNERIFAWIHRNSNLPKANGNGSAVQARDKNDGGSNDCPPPTAAEGEEEEEDEVTRAFLRGDGDEPAFQLECHAVLASKNSRAQTMAATLQRAFHIAYKDWKLDKSRSERSRLVKSLTEKDLDTLRRCKADSGLGDVDETSSVSSSIGPQSAVASDDAESTISVSSAPK